MKNGLIDENNRPKKKLAILKDGIIYWLRKLYIILLDNNFNNNQNSYIYFYYPIKDINLKIKRNFSFNGDKGGIFCKTIEDILEEVKFFLNIPKFYEDFKADIYNEDFDLIKNDNQLMEKNEKYKILYIKIGKFSDEHIEKSINRCQIHIKHRKSNDFNRNELNFPFHLFTNNELKTKMSIDNHFNSTSKNNFLKNNRDSYININKTEINKNENYINDNKNKNIINRIIINQKFSNKNIFKNILKEEKNYSTHFLDLKNVKNNNKGLNRNNTDNYIFPKLMLPKHKVEGLYSIKYMNSETNFPFQKNNLNEFYKKYNIPKIKSKGLWNPINIINKNYKKTSTLPNNNSERKINKISRTNKDIYYYRTVDEDSDIYINYLSSDESRYKNKEIDNKISKIDNAYNNEINKYLTINYINPINNSGNYIYDKKYKKIILKELLSDKDPCDEVFNLNNKNSLNEFLDKNNFIKINKININKNKINCINYNNYNNYKQFNSIIEINQIQFIALNSCIRAFMSEKIDMIINDEDIQKIYNKEQILKNIKEINYDIPINIYLKEFYCYTYLSNYITKNFPLFCNDLYEVLKDYYININNILSINRFKDFIHDFKNIFHNIKSSKAIMIEKLKENYIKKNHTKISWVFFILFMIYDKKNLSTLFDRELLFNILESIDIHFYKDINIEQFIKFKIYFLNNKWINKEMKKKYITKFFNNFIANNKNSDLDLFIIKLRQILKITYENIQRIKNNNFYIDENNIDEIYNKFIEYFNF